MDNVPEPKLTGASVILRLGAIGIVLLIIAGLFAYAAGWLTPHAVTPARITDRFEQLNGKHPGFRRNHAKGLCFTGWFESNGQGTTLSKSIVFQSGRIPVVGRFSLAIGMPYAADEGATARGFAVFFKLPNGEEWRTATVSVPVFPVSTPEAFYDFMLATAPDPATGKPDADRVKAFLADHPETQKALPIIMGQPTASGFANTTYNSLDAFRFINAAGGVAYVRWSWVPVEPFKPGVAHPELVGTNYLFDDLIADVHQQPLKWHLILTVAQPGDPTDDATIPWPAGRQQVDAGTLTVDNVESDDTSPTRNINFDPLVLPNGIEPSDDPLLSARSAVYSRSFTRREGEPKTPSAVTPAEVQK